MFEYFCIGFIGFMFNNKTLADFTNPFSPKYIEKNDRIRFKHFQ